MRSVGYGIVGLGVGTAHVKAALKAEGCHAVVICDKDEKRLHDVGDTYGIPRELRFASLEEMLEKAPIDIVSVCTPSGLHLEVAEACMKAGKHILVEKPVEITLDKIDAMIDSAKAYGVKAGCIFQTRFREGNQRIKNLLMEERLGKLVTANFHVKWYRTQEYYGWNGGWRGTWALDGGGALMNQSIHTVDLMRWLLGPIKSVFAKAGTYGHVIETEDTAVAVVTFENGAIATLIGTTCAYPGLEVSAQIHGLKGSYYAKDGVIELLKLEGEPEVELKQAEGASDVGGGSSNPMSISLEGHAAQVQDMITAVLTNRSPIIGIEEGREAVRIILAIYESARTGKEVFLKR
ncbi:Gfo/Idh/MocA family protein [Paenibacillus roseipurpureus]|uniref:Gfo/Idh/MocA family oxidoreductase n=1 Tax=Paenibacillus roseopurpureus TaxID=2918901 RepID=A0AA96LRL7_9BACL|nr:Gfo/Idh/MocA family oxidoreductase [Paenibacillus sp. MBLB1832]WNR43480.1 Gfo/Idh/MocA family oxidoreductase [Paenibacillus sp. MBLB1832]